jgi:hypothetical protein
VALSAVRASDLTTVPPSSTRPTVVHQEPPVLEESMQDAPKVQMSQVQEPLMPQT